VHAVCMFVAVSRSKMVAMKGVSKLRGQHGQLLYPQPEGQLGECMTKYGRELGDDSVLGKYPVDYQDRCVLISEQNYTHTHTHTRLTALFPGLPR